LPEQAGGVMKKISCIFTIGLILFVTGVSSVRSQTQVVEGYTLVRSGTGTLVCLGRWVPSRDIALPGVCEGELVDINHFNAVSSRMTSDKLDQMLLALSSLDQKLAINNEQIKKLIDVNVKTQTSIDEQVRQVSDLLHETITKRFEGLPGEILEDESFKKELEKLKEDILKEVENIIKQNKRTK
jgi:hypothetical protein